MSDPEHFTSPENNKNTAFSSDHDKRGLHQPSPAFATPLQPSPALASHRQPSLALASPRRPFDPFGLSPPKTPTVKKEERIEVLEQRF